MIKQNLNRIQTEIETITDQEVVLVAVTKMRSTEQIRALIDCGHHVLGENKVQELLPKFDAFKDEASFHLIGHLQRNKVKDIIGKVRLIHSVDSLRLAEEIDRQAQKNGLIQDILLQVNIAREEAKHGFFSEELDAALLKIAGLQHVRIMGLMMMAPLVEDAEEVRHFFRKMKELFDYYNNLNYNKVYMKYLSMGMTNDYLVALQEGSNMIRVGTGLFKEDK